jgi:hypothetical protein
LNVCPCPKITNYNNDYLDEYSGFVFTHNGDTITILGVGTWQGLIPLDELQIQFAQERGWLVADGSDIKDPGVE